VATSAALRISVAISGGSTLRALRTVDAAVFGAAATALLFLARWGLSRHSSEAPSTRTQGSGFGGRGAVRRCWSSE